MKKGFILVLMMLSLLSFGQQHSELYHRARIHYNSPQDFLRLIELDIPVDHGLHKRGVFIESDFSEYELLQCRSNGYYVEILIEDVSSYYKNRNIPGHRDYKSSPSQRNALCASGNEEYGTPANFNVFPANSYGGFYTYSQVLQELQDMATLYPNLITAPADISTFTTEGTPNNGTTPSIGGNPIKWLKISDNPNSSTEGEPQILYTSIHHAREPASLSQLIFFMWYLLENYDSDPEIQAIVNNTELYFIPVMNPDGYLYNELTNATGGGLWRKNRKNSYGVDNNRNYDYYIGGNPANNTWGGPGSSPNTNSSLHHGSGPFSEVENQAVKWFVEQHDFAVAMNNHTFGELIYYPFGYADVPTPDDALYQAFTQEMTSRNGYAPIRDFPFSGDSDDFMYGTVGTHQKIFAMTPEIGASFWPAQSSIEEICKDMMYTNLTAANMVNNFATIENNSALFINDINAQASYEIRRLGLVEPANFNVSINTISANILSVGSSNAHNGLNYGERISDAIAISLDPGINNGELVEYELIINNGIYDRVVSVSRIYGQTSLAFEENGDSTNPNWELTPWSTTSEDFVSAGSSITDSPFTDYANNTSSNIRLANTVDLSAALAANLSFQAKWEIEANFDYVQLEVSINNGQSWIPQCGRFTKNGSSNQSGAQGEPVYDGFQSDWVEETIDLSDYLGNDILIRFRLVSDGSVTEDGFYFDDLKVNVITDNLSTAEFETEVFKIFPNPVKDQLFIQTSNRDYSLFLYSIQGQLLMKNDSLEGNRSFDYSKFASGTYLLTIRSEDGDKTYRIIKN